MVNMSAKFDEEAHKRFSLHRVHKLISIYVNCDLDLWPLTFKINRVHPLMMANMYAKFDGEAHNGLVSIYLVHKLISIYIDCDLDLWPPKLIGFILSS